MNELSGIDLINEVCGEMIQWKKDERIAAASMTTRVVIITPY